MDLIDQYSSSDDEKDVEKATVNVLSIADASSTFERAIPHVRGNWAGHLYFQVKLNDAEHLLNKFRVGLEQLGWSGTLVSHRELHLSLSRQFFLQLSSIDSFVEELKCHVQYEQRIPLEVEDAIILENDQKTRSFLGFKFSTTNAIQRLVSQIDAVMIKYSQPVYYDPPIFHASLASIKSVLPGKVKRGLTKILRDEHPTLFDPIHTFSEIHCSLGKTKHFEVTLN